MGWLNMDVKNADEVLINLLETYLIIQYINEINYCTECKRCIKIRKS